LNPLIYTKSPKISNTPKERKSCSLSASLHSTKIIGGDQAHSLEHLFSPKPFSGGRPVVKNSKKAASTASRPVCGSKNSIDAITSGEDTRK